MYIITRRHIQGIKIYRKRRKKFEKRALISKKMPNFAASKTSEAQVAEW